MAEYKQRQTRGSVVKGYAKYIKKKWGTQGVAKCQKDIGEINFKVADDGWYPEEINTKILNWIADNYGEDYVEKAAESTIAERGVIAYAARLAGIKKVLERGQEDYERNFNYGKLDVEIGENEAIITLTDSSSDKIDCISWRGAFKGVLKLTKKTGNVEEIQCSHDGVETCIFKMTWQ